MSAKATNKDSDVVKPEDITTLFDEEKGEPPPQPQLEFNVTPDEQMKILMIRHNLKHNPRHNLKPHKNAIVEKYKTQK